MPSQVQSTPFLALDLPSRVDSRVILNLNFNRKVMACVLGAVVSPIGCQERGFTESWDGGGGGGV